MSNIVKTVQALKALGLNVETGKSPYFTPGQLEKVSGVRQVSNGCRIIREDKPPFSMFKVQRFYKEDGKTLEGMQFTGYRDSLYQQNITREKMLKKQNKIRQLQKSIIEDQTILQELKGANLSKQIYSPTDLPKYFD